MFEVYDPTGLPPGHGAKKRKSLSTLMHGKVAFVWNQYASTTRFWPELEKSVEALYEPAATERLYKDNTWRAAPNHQLVKTLTENDYLIVGVGA